VVCDAAGLLYEIDMHPDLLDERLCGARDRYGSVRWMLQGVVSARVVDNLIAAKTLHAPTAHPRTPCTGQRRIALVFLKNGLYESADGGKTLTCITGQSAFDTRRSNRYASYRRAMDAIYLSASPRDVRTLISETAYHGDTQRHIHLINLLVRRHFITAYRIDIGQASPITVRYRKQDGVGVLLNPFWRLDHAFAPNPALFAQ
jgi:hypothetical protein